MSVHRYVFSGVRVNQTLVLCVCFVDRCLSFYPFSFGHCVVCSSITDSDYPFGIFKLFFCPIFLNDFLGKYKKDLFAYIWYKAFSWVAILHDAFSDMLLIDCLLLYFTICTWYN